MTNPITSDAQPSGEAVAQAFKEFADRSAMSEPRTSTGAVAWITRRAREIEAARLASTSPAPDGADLSIVKEAIGFAPHAIRDAAWLAFYRIKAAAPQPVVVESGQ